MLGKLRTSSVALVYHVVAPPLYLIRRILQYNRSYVVKMNAKRHLATSQPCWTFVHPNRAPIIDNRRACRLTFVAEADGTVRSFGAKIATFIA